jgi:hypothetical protein
MDYPRGIEQGEKTPGNTHVCETGGAESGALPPTSGPVDADLRAVVNAWAGLPEPVKAGIVAMVKASAGT